MDQLDAFLRGILPVVAGFVVGLFVLRISKVATFTLVVVLATLAIIDALIPIKEMVIEQSRSAVPAIITFLKQACVSVSAGAIVGLLLGVAAKHLRRPMRE